MKHYIKPGLFTDEESALERENRDFARIMATEGIVLLKNEHNTLPLKDNKVALFGIGAKYTIKGGSGSGEVNERNSVTIYEGLKKAGVEIVSEAYLDSFDGEYQAAIKEYQDKMKKAMTIGQLIKNGGNEILGLQIMYPYGKAIDENDYTPCDNAIYVISRQAGEGNDRFIEKGQNDLQERELENIRYLASHFKNFTLVINAGCSLNLNTIDGIDNIGAIIFFAQQGEEGGNAFADIVTGKISPSARLTSTWAMNYNDIPYAEEFTQASKKNPDVVYKEGIYVGYRYFDSFDMPVRFPFGFGLSYTTFENKVTKVSNDKDEITIQVNVKNTGKYISKQVIEAYLSFPKGKIDREYQSLVAYGKTNALGENEEETIELKFALRNASYFDEKEGAYKLDKGDYLLRVGTSSRDTKIEAVITMSEDVVVSKVEHLDCPKEKVTTLESIYIENDKDITNVTKLNINKEDIETKVVSYKNKTLGTDERILKILNSLTIKEAINLVVGAGFFTNSQAYTLPGAVGSTTSTLVDKGLENVLLCDGPAGIRILRRSVLYKNGTIKEFDHTMDLMNYLPKFALNYLTGNPKKGKMVYQYCTAFPTGLALAQSFNNELAKEFGRKVAKEMVKFGVTYWLAPGMNINRNPLCGRNFEYYSEDPLLSGMMAASVSSGVQETDGLYTTIKHYALNNNENDRNFTNSVADERTLREIYLRNFKIAIENGHSKAIMTSYNLINGTYSANRYDTVNKFLRDECGFEGVVMTDWFSTGGEKGKASLCMHAGNDMIMPGTKGDKKSIMEGLKKGECNTLDVKIAAYNIIKQILESYHHEEVYKNLTK